MSELCLFLEGLLPTSKAELLVTGISGHSGRDKRVDDFMYNLMIKFRIMMEYVFKFHNLSYTYGDSLEFKVG